MQTTINTWNPLRELNDISNRLLGAVNTRQVQGDRDTPWRPYVDVTEDETGYSILAELPEVKKEDVSVIVENGILTIKGERNFSKESEETKVHLLERAYGTFGRSFKLPEDADAESVDAQFRDGVLSLKIGKLEEAKPKSIEINVD